MQDLICTLPTPKTPQELEQAIQRYKASSNLSDADLFCQWQAIRDASLAQLTSEVDPNPVPGDDSY